MLFRSIITNPLIALPGSRFFMDMKRYGIELADGHSFLIKHSDTFSEGDMDKARKVSMYVSLLYMNSALLRAVKREAALRGVRTIDFVREFFDGIPSIATGEMPDMVPASISGFRRRNASLAKALENYDDIIGMFNGIASEPITSYSDAFTETYHKTIARVSN